MIKFFVRNVAALALVVGTAGAIIAVHALMDAETWMYWGYLQKGLVTLLGLASWEALKFGFNWPHDDEPDPEVPFDTFYEDFYRAGYIKPASEVQFPNPVKL